MNESLIKRFESVSPSLAICVENRHMYLSHYPCLCYGGSYRNKDQAVWNLFGHVHTCLKDNAGADFNRLNICFPTQYDVGVDFNNYAPISFNEVKEKIGYQVDNNTNLLTWIK